MMVRSYRYTITYGAVTATLFVVELLKGLIG